MVDHDDRLIGVLDTHQVLEALASGEDSDPLALARRIDPLSPDSPVSAAFGLLDGGTAAGLETAATA